MANATTTYQPGSMTTYSDLGGGGGGGGGRRGGGGYGGLDAELINQYRNRAREAAADRERQRTMERQRWQWETQDRQRAMAPRPGGNGPDPDFDLKAKRKEAEMAAINAQLYAPQRELQMSRPGVVGGYGGPDPNQMNAFQRQAYLPQGSQNQGFVHDEPGSERVGSELLSPQEAQLARQMALQKNAFEDRTWVEDRRREQDRLYGRPPQR